MTNKFWLFENLFSIFVVSITKRLKINQIVNSLLNFKAMFENLFLLVKNNAGKAVINNPEIAEKDREAVITEAS